MNKTRGRGRGRGSDRGEKDGRADAWLRPLPAGLLTVDELRWHRKKRASGSACPRDNLRLDADASSMKGLRSEYAGRFRRFEFLPWTDGSSDDLVSASRHFDCDSHLQTVLPARRRRRRRRPSDHDEDVLGSRESLPECYVTEQRDKYVLLPPSAIADAHRSSSLQRDPPTPTTKTMTKRRTQLRLEGELDLRTEQRDKYVPPPPPQPPHAQVIRRRTQLKIGSECRVGVGVGVEVDRRSETSAQFAPVAAATAPRPPLVKRDTAVRAQMLEALEPPPLLSEYELAFGRRQLSPTLETHPSPAPVATSVAPQPQPQPEPEKAPVEPAKQEAPIEIAPVNRRTVPRIENDPEFMSNVIERQKERSRRHADSTTSSPMRRRTARSRADFDDDDDDEEGARFECLPEYRRAYIDYVTRENRSRIPRPPFFVSTTDAEDTTQTVIVRDRRVTPEQKVLVPDLSRGERRRPRTPCSPCRKHRSPSGRACVRRHSPCARLAASQQPPTSSSEDDEHRRRAASFVVLDDANNNNNNNKRCHKTERWMPAWYEHPI